MRTIFTEVKLEEDIQYKTVTAEAHKQPAIPLGAPALTWHLTFAFDRDINEIGLDNIERSLKSREQILKTARSICEAIYTKSQKKKETPRGFFPDISIDDETDVYRFEGRRICWSSTDSEAIICSFDGILIKFIVMIHSDYITLTSICDLSKSMPDIEDETNDDIVFFEKMLDFYKLQNCLSVVKDHINSSVTIADVDGTAARNYLYNDFWAYVAKKVFDNFEFGDGSGFDRVIGDFRGLVLLNGQESEINIIKKNSNIKEIKSETGYFDKFEIARDSAGRMLRLFNFPDIDFDRYEFAACTMLRKRALYLSSLGGPLGYGRPESSFESRPHKPVEFVVLVADVHRWQMGRLIHRINQLGTLRILALRDLDRLRVCSLGVRVLGSDLDVITERLTASRQSDDMMQLESDLLEWFSKLARLERSLPGGISYRIARSRNFANAFERLVEDLDVSRIEGWQPYNEFVRRRLFSVYSYIDRLGERLSRLRARAEALNGRVHVARMKLATIKIKNLSEHIDQANKEIVSFHSFQLWLEFIACVYYGGMILYYIAISVPVEIFENVKDKQGYFIFTAFLIYVSFQRKKLRHYFSNWARRDDATN